jgi:hypothetical protein
MSQQALLGPSTMSAVAPLLGPKLTLSDRINQADRIHRWPANFRAFSTLQGTSSSRVRPAVRPSNWVRRKSSITVFPTAIDNDEADSPRDGFAGRPHLFQPCPALRIAAPTDQGPLPAGKPLSEIVNARCESADRISCHGLRPPCFRSGTQLILPHPRPRYASARLS